MEKQTVFIKRYPSKGDLPKEDVFAVLTNNGKMFGFDVTERTEWWLEEIELPSKEDLPTKVGLHHNTMYHDNNLQEAWNKGVTMCYEYLTNHLKSNTNG